MVTATLEKRTKTCFSKISEKLKNPNTSMKYYWSLVKASLNSKKVSCSLPIDDNNRYVTDSKEKYQLFNFYFSEQAL